LDGMANLLLERRDARRAAEVATAQARATARMVIALPGAGLVALGLLDRAALGALLASPFGWLSLVASAGLCLLGPALMDGMGGIVCLGLLASFGWWYPELRARAAARARVEELERLAPAALDLIASTVAAGVGIDAALAGAAGAVDGALREELERTVA